MTPAPGGDIKRQAFRQAVELLGDKAGRYGIGGLSMVDGAWPVELHADRPGPLCDWRRQFTQPKAYTADRKLGKQQGEDLFAQGFQKGADFLASNFDDPLGDLRIIDGITQMTGGCGQGRLAVQLEVDGHGLGPLPLLGRDAASCLKFEAFDDNFVGHFVIVRDEKRGCQPIVRWGREKDASVEPLKVSLDETF